MATTRYVVGWGTGVVANAVLFIVSSITGGGLVLAGQFFAKRAEDKRVWLIRLHEAASDLATSYLHEAATAIDRRRAGVDISDVETATYVVDGRERSAASGHFRGAAISRRIARPGGTASRASGGHGTNQARSSRPHTTAHGRRL